MEEIIFLGNSFVIYISLRTPGLARLASYNQHSSDTTCSTPVREDGTEASICVPRMFKSHVYQQYDKTDAMFDKIE
jgi:hypothetical protein